MKKSSRRSRKKKKTSTSILRTIRLTLFSIFILSVVAASGIVLAIINSCPSLNINQILDLNETSIIYDNQNKPMDNVIATDNNNRVIDRTTIPINEMSDYLGKAFVSIEDERFYSHNGIDFKRIVGALYQDLKGKITHSSNGIQGASTITQQLIKNRMFLSDSLVNRLSITRKIQEAYLAIQLEKSLSKPQILEAYMNTVFLGGSSYGVEAASKQYFGIDAKNLNLIQCAFIAGINQSPSHYYPFSAAAQSNPSIYINRTKVVLGKMYQNNYITEQQYENAINDLSNNKLQQSFVKPSQTSNKYTYEWFSRPAIEQVKDDLRNKYHYTDTEIINLFMNGGLRIYTTMDRNLEEYTQNVLNTDPIFNQVTNMRGRKIQPQAAAVIMDYHTGYVKAIVGGRGDQPPGAYNRADSSNFLRAVGSSIKPLTVYSAALDSGQATAATLIDDSPLDDSIARKYSTNGVPYQPNNDDFKFSGSQTIRTAIKRSINLIAVKLEDQIGLATGAAYANRFGLTLDNNDKHSIAALSLGQLHHGANPLLMSAAYGVFGNNGIYSYPQLYTKVTDKNGKIILENKYTSKKILSQQSAYIMYDLLKGPVQSDGTGPSAKFGSMPVAGKTGTATDMKDLWFCGLTPYYSGAIWIGNDDWSQFKGLNSDSTAYLWGKIMSEANKGQNVKDIDEPSGIKKVTICMDSGKVATDSCPRTFTEMFVEGTEPTALCDYHSGGSRRKYNKNDNDNNDFSAPDSIPQNPQENINNDKTPNKQTENQTNNGAEQNNGNTIPNNSGNNNSDENNKNSVKNK